jgi:hypothetical protein
MVALGGAPRAALAQDDARLEVLLPVRAVGGGEGPAFMPRSMLATRDLRDLLRGGFPARLHFRCELWRNERFNNTIDAAVEWDMVVRFDQLSRKYEVFRLVGEQATRLGLLDTIEEALIAADLGPAVAAPNRRRLAHHRHPQRVHRTPRFQQCLARRARPRGGRLGAAARMACPGLSLTQDNNNEKPPCRFQDAPP